MTYRNRKSRKSFQRNNSRKSSIDYQPLEPRQMLTVDLGLSFTSATLDPAAPFLAPSVNGDIGPNHFVQVVNGNYSVRLVDGSEIASSTMQFFWQASGADLTIGLDAMDNPILGEIQDSRVVYDHDSGRWFVSSVLAGEDGEDLPGNQILLATSRSNNPIDGFQSVQFVGDTTGERFNNFASLAVDGDGVFIATNNELGPLNLRVSLYAIPKADLTGTVPSVLNMTRFENLDETSVGQTIQFATDLDGDTNTSFALGTFANGTTISLIEISNVGTGLPVTMTQTDVTVPTYEAADDARQLNDVTRLNNISPDITGNVVAQGGYLWTAHAVEGSSSNSAIRWYQIDEVTKTLVNSGDIENPEIDFIYPSIAVNQFGGIAIGMTGSGASIAPSSFLTLGFSAQGLDATPTVTFPQVPRVVENGVDNFVNIEDGINPWGEYSATRVSPDDPFSFFTFQEYASGDDGWSISVGEGGITDIMPVINASNDSNEVVLRRSMLNNLWAEVVIDGVVTDIYEMAALDSIELNLMDGDDTITIDNSLGPFVTDLGITINGGEGSDLITFIDDAGHRFDITGDGSGMLDFDSVFTGFETIAGSNGDDIFTSANSSSDWVIFGGDGNDVFDIGNSVTGNYQLMGESGDDTYRLPLANFASIDVIDSVDAENDSLVGLGTDGDDLLLVNNDLLLFNGDDVSIFGFEGIERLEFDGLAGDDTFNIQAFESDTTIFGNDGNDVINIASDAPINDGITTGILGELSIFGGEGVNRLAISNNSGFPVNAIVTTDQIIGFTAQPINYFDNFSNDADGLQGIVLTGSDIGSDSFDIRGLNAGSSLLARGNSGEEVFFVRENTEGVVVLDGGEGADTYRTTFGENDRTVAVFDSGSDEERDRFSIRVTDGDDIFTVNQQQLNLDRNSFAWDGNLENLIVDARSGNDEVTVNSNETKAIRVVLNEGDDTGIVTGTLGIETLRFDGLQGQDSFQFLNSVAASFVQALGGDDNDTFHVAATSFARSKVDGQAGDDNVEVVFASRDSRRVNARDTGDGIDSLVVTGTPTADRVDLRPQLADREGELVTYNANTENFNMNLLGSNDVLNVFGSSVLDFETNLGVGNDTVNVYQTATPNETVGFDFSMSTGNDTINVFRVAENARVHGFGQTGNDYFNVGSSTLTDDGNLSRIRGDLFLGGGADNPGIDTLQVNDRGAGDIAFEYTITDTSLTHNPGAFEIARPFDAFSFSSMEFVFMSGTDVRNTFNVLPSFTTVFRVDGNASSIDTLNVFGNAEAQGREIFTDGSNGFITFADGSKNISFEEVEIIGEGGNGAMNFGLDPNGSSNGFSDRTTNTAAEIFLDILLDELDLELF